MHLAFVCLLGMGLIDPLIGEIQHHQPELYPYVPFLAWSLLAMPLLSILSDFSLPMIITLSTIGATSAILAEYPTLRIDDDFLMIIVPLFVLYGIELVLV